jgi:hypothetical protein
MMESGSTLRISIRERAPSAGDRALKSSGVKLLQAALAVGFMLFVSPGANARPANDCPSGNKHAESEKVVVSSEQKPNGHRWVKAKILIKACPHVVWETVHEERKKDPDLAYSKVLTEGKNHATLEQKFALIPLIGTATCVMSNREVPLERIDYEMISSDRFKAMEGSWVLSPGTDPNSTYLELSTYCDIGVPIPRPMIEGVTTKKLQRRLGHVKEMAESTQIRLANSNKVN